MTQLRDREAKRAYDAARYLANREARREQNRAYYAANRGRLRERNKRWRAANKERALLLNRRSTGLPEPDRPAPATCECCGGPPGRKALSLDHCHSTGRFRGWLCSRCNTGIGALGDSESGLLAALNYLRRTKEAS